MSEKFRVCTEVGVDLIEMELGKKSVVIYSGNENGLVAWKI